MQNMIINIDSQNQTDLTGESSYPTTWKIMIHYPHSQALPAPGNEANDTFRPPLPYSISHLYICVCT